MTLILTALCKNGICICADKRSKTWNDGVLNKIEDNLKKIYKFKGAPLIIFNHGVNKFNNKLWWDFCLDYENSDRWRGKTLELISGDFKEFIKDAVTLQLKQNAQNMPNLSNLHNAAFVLCGKNLEDNNFGAYELRWSPDFKINYWRDTRLIGSGEGYEKYLKQYLIDNSQSNTIEFWGSIDIIQAKRELIKLFSIATERRKKLSGDEFSDDFDIEYITK
ncbi:MAG: hypothetical protein ABSE17_03935 [Candidatus Levyibacteriota bacterium]